MRVVPDAAIRMDRILICIIVAAVFPAEQDVDVGCEVSE